MLFTGHAFTLPLHKNINKQRKNCKLCHKCLKFETLITNIFRLHLSETESCVDVFKYHFYNSGFVGCRYLFKKKTELNNIDSACSLINTALK